MPTAPSGARISYVPSFVPDARVTSTSQFRVPVQHDRRRGHRPAPERGDGEKAPSIGGGEEPASGDCHVEAPQEERLRYPGHEVTSGLDVDGHHLLVGSAVVQLLAVGTPLRLSAARRGDLPLAPRTGEALDVDLAASGLVRFVGQKAAVRRKHGHQLRKRRLQERDRLAVAEGGQYPNVPARFFPLAQEGDVAPVAGPIAGELQLVRLEEKLLLSLALDGLLEKIVAHGEDYAAAVWRPQRAERAAGAKGEPGADPALQIPDPDVGLPAARIGEVESESIAPRRERRVVVVARVADGLALPA